MGKPKKLLNNPVNVVTELIDGLVAASGGDLRRLDDRNAVVRTKLAEDKVALLIGGGSGHEPMFPGFVGPNLADGAPCGEVFAAPTPDLVLDTLAAVDRGRGVLMVYGNYAGDNMNFDIAAELAEEAGIVTRTVRVWDDVAAAPLDRITDRRGIAGDFFVIKVAGGAAAELKDLDDVYRVAVKARDNTRSMGVALAAGSIPETGERTFELPEDEIEIGMGAHGEPGIARRKITDADAIAEEMTDRILADLPFSSGDEVAVLVNNLGATTCMEMLIVTRKVHQVLAQRGISVHRTDVGSFLTCQEMAGLSITLMKLDDELKRYLDMPAHSFAYSRS
ncbi:dihydroxyacetone kinase subunit DhaK [Pleomorphomonas sp. NRK KF1]|uniref:dihydroxyacetone kinase subunit DhaK n=1 Tax=Pleomorphomonas sp. NRK KF1 TaxID=2943000 RepID=UPI0020433477|nr:dihydroxyacetone kinase subunit DhaK [Pleomorphomonas sp. NRK KF1]MCM5553177.1 dihydroxyacetone kinase subunit DhaK [Pleomorphomonas sp. NRK KF1]